MDEGCEGEVVDDNGCNDITIDMQDVLLIYQCFRERVTLTEQQYLAADVNKDGVINMNDVLLVYQYYRRRIDSL